MADVIWLSTLPSNFNYNSFSEGQQSGLVRTNMDAGPAKVRRRFTAAVETYAGSMTMDSTQKSAFKVFYQTTTKMGSLTIEFPNPVSIGTIDVRFVGTPTYKALENSYWTVSFSIEEIS